MSETEISVKGISEGTKSRRWSKTVETNNASKSYNVREIENGFLICISISYEDEDKGWQYKDKEYYSEKNPLQGEEPKYSDEANINKMLNELDKMF